MTQNTSDRLRQHLITARRHLPVSDRQRASLQMRARLYTWLAMTIEAVQAQGQTSPPSIAAFWPLGDEPDLRPLMTQWDENGIVVLLPVMQGRGKPLTFHRWHHDMALISGPFGVQEPPAHEPHRPDIVLVPTLGFTRHGDRMGYGQGFYDRTLAALAQTGPAPLTIGIAWSQGNLESIMPDYQGQAHDYRLDAVLTPEGWVTPVPTFPNVTASD